MGDRQSSMRSLTAEVTVDDDVVTIVGGAGSSIEFAGSHSTAGSNQPLAGDLTLAAGAGRNAPDSSTFAGVMGNLLGDLLTKTGTYLGGVIGKFSITGAKASHYPSGGVLGVIAAGVTAVDGAVVAVLDGDEAASTPAAAYAVDCLNSNSGSAFGYGLDLQKDAHDGFLAVSYTSAAIRLGGDVVMLTGSGAPTDGVSGTGAGVAGPGSLYFRTTTPGAYINTNTKASPAWKAITHA